MNPDASQPLPPIAGYHPTTLVDWAGRLAAIVFLPRCNLRCRFCHAGPLLAEEPGETIPLERILAHVASRQGWLDGVVICGGEPTLWPTLPELCERFRSAGLAVKLDTNGTFPDRIAALLDARLLDAVAMDLKAPLDDRYRRVCGAPGMDLAPVERSIHLLMEGRVEYEFHTTLCPAFIGEDEIRAMGASSSRRMPWIPPCATWHPTARPRWRPWPKSPGVTSPAAPSAAGRPTRRPAQDDRAHARLTPQMRGFQDALDTRRTAAYSTGPSDRQGAAAR